ncbi:3-dehydroquinate synthase [Streptococcus sobrinus]|uniref:3-dehydroquinate synthase n=3 Tax=Streptococcus sobrinus TaxID=1310 RepID=UPI0002D34998|nr:3-dehydroquinate synthase [Streptococcus sobrinus]AWN18739.1 3-dehydroquinate synthase [Streptococcus sobrinus]AWN61791.1 3-dehydroquinate synthase [Streptococcus sobrinus]AWN63662.1 3-dehydroquinate synthase [Streptococcus sobrinus]SQG20337.1 3-dehydroquinate synthase [Streptococcus sobrinus]
MKLRVDLSYNPYDLVIEKGCLSKVGDWAAGLWKPQKVTLITDNHVASLYAEKVKLRLEAAGFEVHVFDFLEGEASKTLITANKAFEFMIKVGMTRSDGVIGFGGGVVGDLAGFVASTYMRGIHFLQIPTSLTAQVDSSIGGKTGVNTPWAKNIVGTFAQPDGVLIDPDTLETLGSRELVEGMGEVIKYGLISDLDLWQELQSMSGTRTAILEHAESIIYHSCNVKRKIVVEDEFEGGIRMHLNFGHTIGHAIEQTAGYGKVMHGEAVAIGMVQIAKVAERKGLMPAGLSQEIADICAKFSLPTDFEPWDVEKLHAALSHDKKARGKDIKIVLVPELGQATIKQIPLTEMKDYLVK